MIANVLSIAGSDPSGGAGIQADLKAFSAQGTFGMAVITALTAQNTQGVSGVHAAPPEFVAEQIAASTPLRRVTTPEEAADATLFFASRWSRSVTGQNLIVDGGLVFN